MSGEKTLVFLSFDLAHDRDLHDRLLAESKGGSLFSITARSESRPAAADGSERVRAQIAAADAVIVICGEHTDECESVAAELQITREQKKPHLLLWGRRERMCKKPAGSRNEDSIYGWTEENLRNQLQVALRAGRARPVPDHLRRQSGGGAKPAS
jgi:hypothetical protein